MKPVSGKRAAEKEEREQVRQDTFAREPQCVAAGFVPSVDCPPGLECDEVQGRGREPGSHLDLDRTQSLCWVCHRIKTDEPRVAGLLGLYGAAERDRRRGEEPDALPEALATWARIKARLCGHGPAGGDLDAVLRFRTRA